MKHLLVVTALVLAGMTAPALARSSGGAQIEASRLEKTPATPGKVWKKGARYKGNGQAVSNPAKYNLKAPAKGKRWVKDGSNFLLVDSAKGIVISVQQGR